MNLIDFIHFIYKDFKYITIQLANGYEVYDGLIDKMPLEKILFIVYHDVYWHKFNFADETVIVKIR